MPCVVIIHTPCGIPSLYITPLIHKFAPPNTQPNDGNDYIIITQYDNKTHMPTLPPLPRNARYLVHPNKCFDLGTYGWVLRNHVSLRYGAVICLWWCQSWWTHEEHVVHHATDLMANTASTTMPMHRSQSVSCTQPMVCNTQAVFAFRISQLWCEGPLLTCMGPSNGRALDSSAYIKNKGSTVCMICVCVLYKCVLYVCVWVQAYMLYINT